MPFQWQASGAEHSGCSCLGDGLRRPQQEMGSCRIKSWTLQGDHYRCVHGGVYAGDGVSDNDDGLWMNLSRSYFIITNHVPWTLTITHYLSCSYVYLYQYTNTNCRFIYTKIWRHVPIIIPITIAGSHIPPLYQQHIQSGRKETSRPRGERQQSSK